MAMKKTAEKKRPPPKKTARSPRSQPLPGMEQVTDQKMNVLCDDAGDGLEKIEDGKKDVETARADAHTRMTELGIHSYKHAGLKFTRSSGVETVTVKRIKEKDATEATIETSLSGLEGDRDGQDGQD